ncbi:PREDICTED: juxtaposed with another zinc finger protein 1 [Chlamydotis macqueenii]|uniref:juxtaposed with another zinc finger protein 1 n=1 Tax=Chlamydotis macqueenii TaxID=187382 RepID=UPI000529CF5D|nr:PREDICTED: juxtaposed with another zinc finger protein 1 [Chlamydotis macqueenii]
MVHPCWLCALMKAKHTAVEVGSEEFTCFPKWIQTCALLLSEGACGSRRLTSQFVHLTCSRGPEAPVQRGNGFAKPPSSALQVTVPRVQKYFKRSIMLSLAFAHSVWDKESQAAGQSFPDVLQSSEYDEEEVDYEESDSDESWTTESAISSEAILSSMCMNGGDEKPFACPVPGCKKRYKNVNGIKYHAKNGHRTQIRVRKPFKCRCGKSYKTAQGLRHHTINFHPPVSAEIIRKMQQ